MDDLNHDNLEAVMKALSHELGPGDTIDLLLVGGAAGVLAGYLAPHRTTVDCDVMVWAPREAWSHLVRAARNVADAFDLPDGWLENASRVFVHTLLPGWESRRVRVLESGRLTLRAPSRVDFIAMKLIAGRDVDLDDVLHMRMTKQEHEFIRSRFLEWPEEHFASGTIPGAIDRLDAILDDGAAA